MTMRMTISAMKILIGLLSCLLVIIQGARAQNAEEQLVKYLETRIHPLVRPVNTTDEVVRVRMYISLWDFRMDDATETFHVYAWVSLWWRDKNVKWTKDDYGGLWYATMPRDKVWHPAVELLNRKFDAVYHNDVAYVLRFGAVYYGSRVRLTVPCSMDLSYFPYDTQTCYMNFSSTLYNDKEVSFKPYRYVSWWYLRDTNGNHWKMVKTKVKRYLVDSMYKKEKGVAKYDLACMSFVMRRISAYFTFVYVGPAVILSLLTVVIFLLPPADPQKTSLGSVLLIGYTLVFIEVGTILPSFHANVPIIDKYYMAMFVLLALSVVFTAVITNLTRLGYGMCQPPELLKKVAIEYLGRCLCIPYSPVEFGRKVEAGITNVNLEGASSSTTATTTTTTATTTTKTEKQPNFEALSDWLHIAAIFDRLLLFCYLVVTIIITATILNRRP